MATPGSIEIKSQFRKKKCANQNLYIQQPPSRLFISNGTEGGGVEIFPTAPVRHRRG